MKRVLELCCLTTTKGSSNIGQLRYDAKNKFDSYNLFNVFQNLVKCVYVFDDGPGWWKCVSLKHLISFPKKINNSQKIINNGYP